MKSFKQLMMFLIMTLASAGILRGQEIIDILENDNGRYGLRWVEDDAQTYTLIYPYHQEALVRIRLMDTENRIVYADMVHNYDGFERTYDLAGVPEGRYYFEVLTKTGKMRKGIQLLRDMDTESIDVSVDHQGGDESFKLTVKGVRKMPVYVDIYDEQTGQVYEDIIDLGKDFSRIYSIQAPFSKYITLQIRQDDQSVIKKVNLK